MTEAELVESITSYFDIAVSGMALYLTACSGYLIVAYLVGKKLTRSQNFIISTLFCFMASVMTYAGIGKLAKPDRRNPRSGLKQRPYSIQRTH